MNEILTQEQFLLQESVKYINDEWEKGLKSWFNIGEYVLANFFDNDPEKASSKAWNKEHSFRKLCEQPELRMPKSTLHLCKELVVQERIFFTVQAPGQSLSKSHKQLLLPVPPEDKIETADEIADMSYRDARDLIKQKYQKDESWLRMYTMWNFPQRTTLWGLEHDGNIPGEIVANVLYYYTGETDLVVDPFIGGGSTMAVCQEFNRQCWAGDLTPRQDVIEKYGHIVEHDATQPFPPECKGAKLVFLDPPYWQQKKGDYSGKPTDLSNTKTVFEFHEQMKQVLQNSYDVISDGGYCGFIIGITDKRDTYVDHMMEIVPVALHDVGFKYEHRFVVPYTTQQYTGADVKHALANKKLLNTVRDLVVFRKE